MLQLVSEVFMSLWYVAALRLSVVWVSFWVVGSLFGTVMIRFLFVWSGIFGVSVGLPRVTPVVLVGETLSRIKWCTRLSCVILLVSHWWRVFVRRRAGFSLQWWL